MLSYEQLVHFADHGWVLMEGVLAPDQCDAYIAALDRCAARRVAFEEGGVDLTVIDNIVFYDDLFLDWFKLPGLLDANRQILGAHLRFQGVNAHIKKPHPDRHTRKEALNDPGLWGWHRGLRPKWGNFPHDEDPRLMNCAFLNNLTYLTSVSPGDGSTAILDGSHKKEGDYSSLKEECPIVFPQAPPGSVLLFTETLLHSAVPILSERTRYTMYYGFVPPWFCCWPKMDVPAPIVESLADAELRDLLGPPHYGGQHPEIGLIASAEVSWNDKRGPPE